MSHRVLICLACSAALLLSGCETQDSAKEPSPVTATARESTLPPKLNELQDLGSLDISVGDFLPWHLSDGRFSPGEWILLKGRELGSAQVSIDGIPIAVTRYWEGQPLVRIPNGLSPLQEHRLSVQTEKGSSDTAFTTSHYIVATDTDGKSVHLVRTNPAAKGGVEEEWLRLDGDMVRPMFALFGESGEYIFAVDITERAETLYPGVPAYKLQVVTYHAAHPDSPKAVARFDVDIGSSPVDMTLNKSGQLLVLGKRSFVLLDASDPLRIRKLANRRLPWNEERTTYVDAAFFDSDRHIAFLETHENRLVVLANEAASDFPLVQDQDLLPSKGIPLSVDLEVDPEEDSKIWVLQGPNYRLADDAAISIYKRLRHGAIDDSERTVSRLQSIEWQAGRFQLGSAIDLPRNYAAYFAKFNRQGRLLVTMSKLDFINLQSEHEEGESIVEKIRRYVWDSMAIGRVLEVDLESGSYETAASGVGLYYHLVDVPEIGPVFSLLKFGPSFSFPYLSPTWGLGISSTGTYAKRKMDGKAIFPPYSVGFVDYQY